MSKMSAACMVSVKRGTRISVVNTRRAFFSNKKTDVGNEFSDRSRVHADIIPKKPVEIPVVNRNPVYTNLMTFSVCGSVFVLLAYIIYIKQPSDFDDIFNIPPEEFVALVDRDLLRRQIRLKKAAGKDVSLMEAELSLMNSQIDEIRSRSKKVALK
uniref:Uncharacterized protein n=1 Tax=Ditylenchus dipsaci TaxID=166011 RepID=A0A915CM00_9BILA